MFLRDNHEHILLILWLSKVITGKTNVQLIYPHEINTGIQYLDPWTLALRISIEGSGNLIVKKTETIGWIFAG